MYFATRFFKLVSFNLTILILEDLIVVQGYDVKLSTNFFISKFNIKIL